MEDLIAFAAFMWLMAGAFVIAQSIIWFAQYFANKRKDKK